LAIAWRLLAIDYWLLAIRYFDCRLKYPILNTQFPISNNRRGQLAPNWPFSGACWLLIIGYWRFDILIAVCNIQY
jgi:hypothetical protein